jgi:hypothetical protein
MKILDPNNPEELKKTLRKPEFDELRNEVNKHLGITSEP